MRKSLKTKAISKLNVIKQSDDLQYVDLQIGGVAPLLQLTRTRIYLPNSMVRMYAERQDCLGSNLQLLPATGNFSEDPGKTETVLRVSYEKQQAFTVTLAANYENKWALAKMLPYN